jgi:alkanesulfonate monooxygenase SsuD/methylene tetrahydromethanopterin reductase-like flavin-dependent oxidoreductase (luciferase family)
MPPVGLALPGGLALPAHGALALLEEAADGGVAPLFTTEVNGLDALATVSALAARRPGVALGTGVIPLGARSEPALAMAASTVAALSGTTFYLGVGVSTPAVVEAWHGAQHDPTVDRTRTRLREIQAVLAGERRGSFSLSVDPAPGRVTLLLGAMGPRMVALGYEEADGVIVNHTPPDALARAPEGHTQMVYVWLRVADDAEARVRRELVSYACAPPYARHFTRLGFGEDVEEVARLRAGRRLREAPDRLSDTFVDALYVDEARLGERLDAIRAVGAIPVVLPVTGEDPAGDVARAVAVVRDRVGG